MREERKGGEGYGGDSVREEEEEGEGYGGDSVREEEGVPGSLGKSLSSEQRHRAQATCWPFFPSAEKGAQNVASPFLSSLTLGQLDMVCSHHLTFSVEQSLEEELAL